MNLDDVMQNEISPKRTNTTCLCVYEVPNLVSFIGAERRMTGARSGLDTKMGSDCSMNIDFSGMKGKKL